ncbi:peptidoglycan recognition protein family protein [Herpetosiphon llansteffanensis]|uniref:peptidoglycan recognition protein family protein n=1 Tax=Herpetosiphon llansteffanensis TaxID=2094568 RepID=UPI000D7D0616|nr:peptidoglycan recognition family protein [Herpetosiphon llansteffanensis]
MSILDLPVVDIRHLLLRRPSRHLITRPLNSISGSAVHYNGDATDIAVLESAEIRHLQAIAKYHVGKIWGYAQGVAIYGHGIMYHYAIGATGTIYWLRNQSDILWHCGNATGNNTTVAVHAPIGGKQRPADKQWDSMIKLFNALADDRGFHAKSKTLGHKEWNPSECPGIPLMDKIKTWRNETDRRGRYEVISPDGANVRQAPTTQAGIAVVYPVGYQFDVYGITRGQSIAGIDEWLNSGDMRGFVHPTTSRKIA